MIYDEIILVVAMPSIGEALIAAKSRRLPVRLIGTHKKDILLEASMADYDKVLQWFVHGGDTLRYTTTYERLDSGL